VHKGPLLGHIISELKSKRAKPQTEKVFQFYSGHDTNIIGLLNTMGAWDEKLLPPYCGALIFELRKLTEDDYIVTVSLALLEKGVIEERKVKKFNFAFEYPTTRKNYVLMWEGPLTKLLYKLSMSFKKFIVNA
jgi:hypothetical protein